jgi:hypothetical protein
LQPINHLLIQALKVILACGGKHRTTHTAMFITGLTVNQMAAWR